MKAIHLFCVLVFPPMKQSEVVLGVKFIRNFSHSGNAQYAWWFSWPQWLLKHWNQRSNPVQCTVVCPYTALGCTMRALRGV